jgi:hypothetical protein
MKMVEIEDYENVKSKVRKLPFSGWNNLKEYCEPIVERIKEYMGEEYKNVEVKLVSFGDDCYFNRKTNTAYGAYLPRLNRIEIYLNNIYDLNKRTPATLTVFISTVIHELVHWNRMICRDKFVVLEGRNDVKKFIELDVRIQTLKIFSGFEDIMVKELMIERDDIRIKEANIIGKIVEYLVLIMALDYDDTAMDTGIYMNKNIYEIIKLLMNEIYSGKSPMDDVPWFGWGHVDVTDIIKIFETVKVVEKEG